VREPATTATWQQRLGAQPLWLLAAAGLALVVLVLAGLILSRVPGRVEISGGQVQVVLPTTTSTPTVEAAVVATRTRLVATSPTPTSAPMQAATPTAARPTATAIQPAAEIAALSWEQVSDGATFRRADVAAIAVDPQNPNVVYAAASDGLDIGAGAGIYKSSDGGETWTPANAGLDHPVVTDIFIDPLDTQVVYATTFGAGPYKSTDGGARWKPINAGLTHLTGVWNGVSSLAFDPADHLRLYHIDPQEGVFRSTDGGERWQLVNKLCQEFITLALDPRDGAHLFAGAYFPPNDPNNPCPGGLYESTDGGQSWTPIARDIPNMEKAGVWQVLVDPRAPDSLYALMEYAATDQPILDLLISSTDGGRNWAILSEPGFWPTSAFNLNDGGNVYAGLGTELYRSDDGGRTWASQRGGFEGDIKAVAFSPTGADTLYVGAAGVYRTNDGGQSWKAATAGFGGAWLELTFDSSGKTLYAEDNDCTLYSSQDGGATWEDLQSPGCGLAFDRQNDWLYREDEEALYRSTDGGRTWSKAGPSAPTADPYRLYVNPQDPNVLYSLHSCCGPNPFIHRSTDGGKTWEPLPTVSNLYHGRLAIASDGAHMYAVSNERHMDVSEDGGDSWRQCQATNNNGQPPALALHPQDGNILFLGTWGEGILKSTNACETWSSANVGLDNLFVNTLAYDPQNPNILYAGTDGGAFVSLDGGETWNAISNGLGPSLVVYSIAVDPNDSSKVYAATPDGIFRLESAPTGAAERGECRIAFSEKTDTDINDIYITDCDGSNRRWVTEGRVSTGHEPAWSPDGQRLVFDENPNLEFDKVPAYLYIINADGTNRTQIVAPDGPAEGDFPVWSPDGNRIAWKYGCEIMTIRPDGSDRVTVLDHRELSGAGDPEMCANRPRWSPDSQQFALTTFPLAAHHDPTIPGPYEYGFYVVNADGTGLTELASFQLAYPRLGGVADVDVFWLPNGRQVALEVREGERAQRYQMNADGSGEMEEIDSIPESWRPWYWPQWGGEAQTAPPVARSTPVPLSPGYVSPGTPPAEGRIVEHCERIGLGAGLCIFPYRSGAHTAILQDAGLYLHNGDHFSWSPDGKQIAFAAATAPDAGPQIYTVNADGTGLTRITFDGDYNHQPSWSPDGEWIAFTHGADLAIVRPDGSSLTVIHRRIGGRPCILEPHWSPDSQWLVGYADVNGCPDTFPVTREVWVFSRDGQTVRVVTPPMIHKDASFKVGSLGFSPDGTQVIYIDEQGQKRIVRADGSAEPELLTNWPDWWGHNFYPQWAGESAAATPVPGTEAEEARAFTEPILAAIADRPPDYQDDFSDPASGWDVASRTWEETGARRGETGYVDGEYFVTAAPDDMPQGEQRSACNFARSSLPEFSDLVLEVDGRVSGSAGQWQIYLREWAIEENHGQYYVALGVDGGIFVARGGSAGSTDLTEPQLSLDAGQFNHVQVIARGPRLAVSVNGELVISVADPGYTDRFAKGTIGLGLCNHSDAPMEARWDNLKIWDISSLSLP
jgi:Tol biopolymer transport system component